MGRTFTSPQPTIQIQGKQTPSPASFRRDRFSPAIHGAEVRPRARRARGGEEGEATGAVNRQKRGKPRLKRRGH